MTITASTYIALGEAFDGVEQLPLDLLDPAVDNPRTDLGELDELVASIHVVGIIEPLVVTANAGGYTIVAGHRRYAAAQQAGLYTVPCIHRAFDSTAERVEVMTIENLQRQDLSPLDEARAFQMLTDLGHSQRQIAERVGCNQSHVSRRLALVNLPNAGRDLLAAGTITVRQAEEIAALPDTDIDGVVAKVVKLTKDYKGRELPGWAIPDAIGRTTRERKHAAAVAAGKASKLKKLTADPRYHHSAEGYEKCKKAEATAWYVGNSDQSVIWARERLTDDGSTPAGPKVKPQWQLDQEERDRVAELRAELLDRLRPADLIEIGATFILEEFANERSVSLDPITFDPDPNPLDVIAYAAVDCTRELATKQPNEGSWRYGADSAIWSLWARIEETVASYAHVGERPNDAKPGEQIQPAELPPAIEANGIEWGDEDPADAAQQIAEGDAAWSADRGFDVVKSDFPIHDLGGRAEQIYNEVVEGRPLIAGRPDIVQRLPWGTYKAAKEHKLVERIGRLTDVAKIRQAIAYEWAKGGRRPAVLAAAIQRLDDLAWEAGVEE